ncbi:MAG: hypothetical protein WCT40_04925 [Candidatus Magasanikbacteria bacterium]|jgi:hypothetical protein
MKFLVAIVFAIFASFLACTCARAFSISPLRFLVTVDPGSTQTIAVTIKNDEGHQIMVRPVVLGARQNVGGQTEFVRGIDRAEQWTKPSGNSFVIAKKSVKKISFTVTVPLSAGPGSHYLAVGAETISEQTGVGISGRLLTLLTVQVAGEANEKVAINKWKAVKLFTTQKNWSFDSKIKNDGNVEVPFVASAIVRNWSGDERASFPLTEKSVLLAGTGRTQNYSFDVNGRHLWPGFYQVQMQVNYGLTGQTATAIANLIYIPLWSWGVLGLIVLVIIGAFTSQYEFQMGR